MHSLNALCIMVIRYIGKQNLYWKGKTLFQIACNFKDFAVGRVVVRWSFLERYPEKSYYILTRIQPDMTDPERKHGIAWGIKVFRGVKFPKEQAIDAGFKRDWRVIRKDEEEEFCKLTDKDIRPVRPIKTTVDLPPLLEAMVRREKGETLVEPLKLKLNIRKSPFTRAVN